MVLDGGFRQSHQPLVMTLLPGEFSPHNYIHIGYLLAVFENINLDKESKIGFSFTLKLSCTI